MFLPFSFLMYRETPVMVPPVPTPDTSTSISPFRVFPNLRARRLEVHFGIRRILELLQKYEAVRVGRLESRRPSRWRPSSPAPLPSTPGSPRTPSATLRRSSDMVSGMVSVIG
jgi:hypothetical protein